MVNVKYEDGIAMENVVPWASEAPRVWVRVKHGSVAPFITVYSNVIQSKYG